jgi:peroxiredoxin
MGARKIGIALSLVGLAIAGAVVWHFGSAIESGNYFIFRPEPRRPATPSSPTALGDFTLLDHTGVIQSLHRFSDSKAVVIVGHGNSCPILQKYVLRLNELNAKYAAKGVTFLMINPNSEDSRENIIQEGKDYGLQLPVLLDPSQIVTRRLGLMRTADTVIIDPKTWEIVYHGAIDDRLAYGVDKQVARHDFLSEALDDVLAGRAIHVTPDAAKGCAYSFFQDKEISYSKDIAPVVMEKCLNCHNKDAGFKPFFNSYDTVHGWAAMIRETLFADRMPPYSVDDYYGKFRNDIRLSPEQKHKFVAWVDAGAPRGDGPDPLPDYKRRNPHAKILQRARPIYEVSMDKPVEIPPGGTLEYKFFQLGGAVPRDLWVTAFNTKTTNARQIHHEALMVVPKPLKFYEEHANEKDVDMAKTAKDGEIKTYILSAISHYNRENRDPGYSRVQVWSAGRQQPTVVAPFQVIHIPKGHYLILEAHYMGTGRTEAEQTTLQFFGTLKRGSRRPLHGAMLRTDQIEIPPGSKHVVVETHPWRPRHNIDATAFLPHMHMRGKSIKLVSIGADGTAKVLFSMPNFYYGWQTGANVIPEPPIHIEKDTELRAICEYDNSAQNPNNPDPSKTVKFGQTVDRTEMCHLNVSYVVTDER